MKLGRPTQFDMLKKIKVAPELRITLCAIFILGYLKTLPRRRYCGKFLIVSYTDMKLGNPTQFDILKKDKSSSQLGNTLCAIFRQGYSCPVHETHCQSSFGIVSYTAMKLGRHTQFDILKQVKKVPRFGNTPSAKFRLGYLCPVHGSVDHVTILTGHKTVMKLGKPG